MKTKLRLISLFSALIMALLCFTGCSPAAVIDGTKCVSVEFDGYNGDGTASVNVDYDYILSLLGDMNARTADSVAGSISAETIKESGSLSNGDTVTVKLKAKADVLENANVAMFNTEIPFTVSGLKEKEKVDLFKNVEIKVNGTSPECSVSFSYTGAVGSPYNFTLKRADGKKTTEYYKNGDKITVSLTDEAAEALKKKYIIEETSREYTVQADKKYVLAASDLDAGSRERLISLATETLTKKLNSLDTTTKCYIVSGLTGINAGSVLAGTSRIYNIENIEYNSSYVGIEKTRGAFGGTKEYKCIYLFYNADISYYFNQPFNTIEEELNGVLVVRLSDPVVSTDGNIYWSKTEITSKRDIQAALDSKITSDFAKIS